MGETDDREIVGYEPTNGSRLIQYAHDGFVYAFPITTFVVFQTMRFIAGNGTEPTPDLVARHSPAVAKWLSDAGWFTHGEYMEAWIQSETEDLDDELRGLL